MVRLGAAQHNKGLRATIIPASQELTSKHVDRLNKSSSFQQLAQTKAVQSMPSDDIISISDAGTASAVEWPMLKTSLRYLMSVVRHGSIRAASGELNIAQSAVSRRLQSLEQQVGTPLFERKPRGVELTEAGELLYAYCLKSTFAIERLYSEFDELRSLQRGRVRLAAMESAVPSVVCNAIDAFKKQYRNIVFYVDVLTSDRILDAIRDGDFDLGLTFGEGFSEEIEVVYTAREPLMAAMRPDHPLANRSSVTIQELAHWPMALAPPQSSSRVIFDSGCTHAGVIVKPTLETNSIELMHRFAVIGTGVTMLLRHAGMSSFTSGHLVAVPVEGDKFAGNVSIIKLNQRTLPLAAERFLLALREELIRLPVPSFPSDAVRASATAN